MNFSDAMDKMGLQPVIDYLKKFRLPSTPTILNVTENHFVNYLNYSFDWVQSISVIKKQFGGDLIIGFDIFPDPTNRTTMRMVVGTPESDTILPLYRVYFCSTNLLHFSLTTFSFSKTKYEEILAKAERKQILDNLDGDEEDSESVNAYKQYITEVMSALVFYDNPTMDLEKHLPNMKIAAETILKISKSFYEVCISLHWCFVYDKFTNLTFQINKEAENSTDTSASDPLSEIVFVTANELQNYTDALIFPKSVPIWEKYLNVLFGEFKEVQLDINTEKLLTSKPDIWYLKNIVEYIFKLPKLEIELYIWWNVVEELVLHTVSDIRKLHNEYARKITKLEGGISRSEYCTGGVNKLLGMAVSYSIAESDFLVYTRPKVVNMLNNIREAFNNLVRETTWMDDGTKCSTLEKSIAMDSLIGFPDWILEKGKLDRFYSGIECNKTTHLRNMMVVVQWKMERKLRMFKTIDEFQWATTPTNVNAFHTFQSNAISKFVWMIFEIV